MRACGCSYGAEHLNIRQVTTVFSAFERTARAHGAKPFLQALPQNIELDYAQALKHTNAIAARYRRAGFGPGHRVALKLPSRAESVLHFLALNSIGVSVVPLNPQARPAELDYIVQ